MKSNLCCTLQGEHTHTHVYMYWWSYMNDVSDSNKVYGVPWGLYECRSRYKDPKVCPCRKNSRTWLNLYSLHVTFHYLISTEDIRELKVIRVICVPDWSVSLMAGKWTVFGFSTMTEQSIKTHIETKLLPSVGLFSVFSRSRENVLEGYNRHCDLKYPPYSVKK